MIHKGIDYIPCCQVHPNHFNWSDDSSQLVLIQAFPCEDGEVFIGAIISIPVGYLLASGKVSTIFIVTGNDLEIRVSTQGSDLPCEGRSLKFEQSVQWASARELSAVVKDSPFIRRSK